MGILIYLTSFFIGAELGIIIVRIMNSMSFSVDGIMSWTIFTLSILLCLVSAKFIQHRKFKYFARLLRQKKIHHEFLKSLRAEISLTSDRVLKIRLTLLLSGFHLKEKEHQKAFDIIKEIKQCQRRRLFNVFSNISKGDRLDYYLQSIYLNLIFNNIVDAQNLYEASSTLIFEHEKNKRFHFEINRTLGFLEYSKGIYDKADCYVTSAIDSCTDLVLMQELKLLKAKIYIKTYKTESAHKILEKIIDDNISYAITESAKALIIKSI